MAEAEAAPGAAAEAGAQHRDSGGPEVRRGDEPATAERPGRPGGIAGRFSVADLPRTIAWARSWREHQLTVRINPALAVELDASGADVKVTGAGSGLRVRLVASSLRGDKLRGPLDLSASSSSVKLSGLPTGESRISCESSSVRLSLSAGADLRITAANRMGRVALPGQSPSTLPFEGETSEATVGDGHHRLTIDAVMSSVTVITHAWARPERGSGTTPR